MAKSSLYSVAVPPAAPAEIRFQVDSGAEVARAEPQSPPAASTRHAWLLWQCQMITGTVRGEIFEVSAASNELMVTERWPKPDPDSPALATLAARAAIEHSAVKESCHPRDAHDQGRLELIAQPVFIGTELRAVVALSLKPRSELQLRAVMQLLQWGCLWLETLLGEREIESEKTERGAGALSILEAALGARDIATAATAVCDTLGTQYRFDRVSLGLRDGLRVRVIGASSGVNLAGNSALRQDLEAAMTEACDLKSTISHPSANAPALCHQALARRQGMAVIRGLPLVHGEHCEGALILERAHGEAPNAALLAALGHLTPVLGRQLRLMHEHQHSPGMRLSRVWQRLCRAQPLLAMIILVIGALCIVTSTYRVPGPASIEGTIQRAVVAPVDGFLANATVRAGDVVAKGALLASLEDRDLAIENEKWRSELESHAKEYSEALALHERVRAGIARARMDQTRAELHLVEERLARTKLRAPFAGIVVSGDFSRALGTPVTRGQVLFEIAPLKDYRVIAKVGEADIGEIAAGQRGYLRLAGMPQRSFAITVERVAPVAVAGDGQTYFRVESRLDRPDALVRPGMQGIAKFEAGKRPLLWAWTHDLWARVRLWCWSLGF